ncbi:Hypothetical protein I5071_25890 [Sandaracinus amylolyticus]|nr:Hypothetical protein I5071_25890 [Sandaracinus amylolyticus]
MLERAGASGELEASAREGRAKIVIREGRVIAIDAPSVAAPRLGHLLVGSGVDAAAVERAAATRESGVRVGDAVVRAGLAGQGAISHALRVQLRARVRSIAGWDGVELRFERCAPRPRAHEEPSRAGELLLGAMRDALSGATVPSVRDRIGEGSLVLTPLGEALVGGAPLWPDEQALAAVLRRPSTLDALERACRGSDRAFRLLLALRVLEGAAPPPPGRATLSLLARKAREIRRATSAEALLDLPRGARPDEARAAWRKLAATLHPDRFAHGVPAPLLRVSTEVACAINGAARELRAAR